MAKFTDNAKRDWDVDVTVATIKRVRSAIDVDLLGVLGGDLIERLMRDPMLLCDVLYVVCKPQADERKITDEQFGESMAGDAIEHATKALLDAIVSFCPSPRERANLGLVLKKTDEVLDKAYAMARERLESPELMAEVEKKVLESLGDLSGSAPESAGSTPDP